MAQNSMKPLAFTKHAREAIAQRELQEGWIAATAIKPKWTQADPGDREVERRFRHIPEFGNRILRVVCLETSEQTLIITAFFDRDARRPQ